MAAAARLARLCKVNKSLIKRSRPRTYPPAKIKLFNEIGNLFDSNSKIIIFHLNALSGEEWTNLHCEMKKEKFNVKKLPNKLVQTNLKDGKFSNITHLFKSSTGVAYCNSDEVAWKSLIKSINNFSKIEMIGAIIDGTLMKKSQVEDYAKLPTLSQLHEELVQLLAQPAMSLHQTVGRNQSALVNTLANLSSRDHVD